MTSSASHSSSPSAPEPEPRERVLVVGASSGIGAALVRQLASEGCRVAAVARRTELLEELAASCPDGAVLPFTHDVTAAGEVPALLEQVRTALGGLDTLVYVAGVMPLVGAQEYDHGPDRRMVQVNLLGGMAWCAEVARLFVSERRGTIVGISSVAGDRGRRMNPAYHASKAGFTTYLESLRNRLEVHGVRVVTIKPGMVETPMTAEVEKLVLPITAEQAARATVRTWRGRLWSTRYVPLVWWPIMRVIQALPSRLFRHLEI
jgi:NAD(P)-dependent dehydrogenase (short-subunit alcohol dehydrogenase family)